MQLKLHLNFLLSTLAIFKIVEKIFDSIKKFIFLLLISFFSTNR
jgi:hypothetical protein